MFIVISVIYLISNLPLQMNIFTQKIPRQQLVKFNDKNICAACEYNEKKYNSIDWNEREKELIELLNKYRKNDGSYDCLVSGSGGKDSIFAAWILKYKYK